MKKKRILLVDDDGCFLEELAEMLNLSGYEPACVSDASLVFAAALDIVPDVVLLDLKMPGLNGFQVADGFARNSLLKNIPIIAMTGHFIQDKHNILMNSCGIKDCLKKPLDSFEVITKIETVLADSATEDIMIIKNKNKK